MKEDSLRQASRAWLLECTGVLHACFTPLFGFLLFTAERYRHIVFVACNLRDKKSVRTPEGRRSIETLAAACGPRGDCESLAAELCSRLQHEIDSLLESLGNSLAETGIDGLLETSLYLQFYFESYVEMSSLNREGCTRKLAETCRQRCTYHEYSCREHGNQVRQLVEVLRRCLEQSLSGKEHEAAVNALEDAEKWLLHAVLDMVTGPAPPRTLCVATHDYGVYLLAKHCLRNILQEANAATTGCQVRYSTGAAEKPGGAGCLHVLMELLQLFST